MSEQNHPWCSNTARDEAIRAAEDAASAERTPLPDHRDLPAAVADLRRRVEGLEAVADAWRRQCEAAADAEKREAGPGLRAGVTFTENAIFREAKPAIGAVNAAADVSCGEADGLRDVRDSRNAKADGLRTERVTLEITHGSVVGAAGWSWGTIIRVKPGESVRVVEDRTGTDIGNGVFVASTEDVLAMCRETESRLTAERDAALRHIAATEQSRRDAIRERDAARERAMGHAKAADELRAARDAAKGECERLRARVAELERERDEARAEAERLKAEKAGDWKAACESALAASITVGNLKARVAELEGQRDSARADAERRRAAAERLRAEAERLRGVCENVKKARDEFREALRCLSDRRADEAEAKAAAPVANPSGEIIQGPWMAELREGILALEHMIYVFREDERPTVTARMEKLRRLVEVYRDYARPILAANAGGPNQEPVGYGVRTEWGQFRAGLYTSPRAPANLERGDEVVPLYAAPQPPRGWLTEEEREAVERAAHVCYQSGRMGSGHISDILRAIIARSTPPRVKAPSKAFIILNGESMVDVRDNAWIAAIRDAGGEVG